MSIRPSASEARMRSPDPILIAAKDAFIAEGFGNTSMDEIAARAGTTKRTVYNRFGSKEQLLEGVIDYSITLFEASVPALAPEAGIGPITGFCELSLQLMTWRAAIGLQRMAIAEWPAFPTLAGRLATRTSAALCQPLSNLFQSRGPSSRLAQASAAATIDMLTLKGRLDRLAGLRPPYPLAPGRNALDALDHAAVRAAIQHVTDRLVEWKRCGKGRSFSKKLPSRRTRIIACED